MSNQPHAAAKYRWSIARLDWEYDPRWPRFHRWGVSDGCRGVGGRANPVTAYLALRRWRKVPASPGAHR